MDILLAVRFDLGAIPEFFFNDLILKGVRGTLQVTVLSMLLGTLLGIVLGVMRVSQNRGLAGLSSFYVWFVRGTPVLIQLLVIHNGLPQMVGRDEFTDFLTPFRSALITFSLNEAAYMAEIVRAGIQAIESGQMDAAKSLGMTNLQAMRRIILPQALRVIIPASRRAPRTRHSRHRLRPRHLTEGRYPAPRRWQGRYSPAYDRSGPPPSDRRSSSGR